MTLLILSKVAGFFLCMFLMQWVSTSAKKDGKVTNSIKEAIKSHEFTKTVGVKAGETHINIRSRSSVVVDEESKLCTMLAFFKTGKAGPLQTALVQNGCVLVDVTTTNVDSLQYALKGIGASEISCYSNIEDSVAGCTACIPKGKIKDLDNINSVLYACVAAYMVNSGSFVTEGDKALYADLARAEYGTDGSGINVCIISDSFNCTCLADFDIEEGDLPPVDKMKIIQDVENWIRCDYTCFDGPENCDYCLTLCFDSLGKPCFDLPENCFFCDENCFYNETSDCGPQCAFEGENMPCYDDGRKMMQVIHDVAPGANLIFAAAKGYFDMASIIDRFVNQGACDIIVDNIFYYTEPMFQDGLIARAVDRAVNKNVTYITAVGNFGRNSWEGQFVDSGFFLLFEYEGIGSKNEGKLHQFGTDDDGQPIITQKLVLPNIDYKFGFIFQWDEPFGNDPDFIYDFGSRSDINIFLLRDGSLAFPLTFSRYPNIDVEPVEGFFFNPSWLWFKSGNQIDAQPPVIEVELAITLVDGPPPSLMKLIVLGPPMRFEMSDGASTIFGHFNSAKACAVGAADYQDTPAFGVDLPEVEDFSSVGGTPILFRKDGTRQSNPIIRKQPCFIGPNGGQVSVNFIEYKESLLEVPNFPTVPNRYYGTSAAAAHVAAVAALILGSDNRLLPADVYNKMKQTATEMLPFQGEVRRHLQDEKFDFNTGYGFINAYAALSPPTSEPTPAPTLSPTSAPTYAPTPTPAPTHAPTPAPVLVSTPVPMVASTSAPVPALAPAPVSLGGSSNFILDFFQSLIDAILALLRFL